jgi:hypothetical protein
MRNIPLWRGAAYSLWKTTAMSPVTKQYPWNQSTSLCPIRHWFLLITFSSMTRYRNADLLDNPELAQREVVASSCHIFLPYLLIFY